MARDRFEKLAADVEAGAVQDIEGLQARLAECHAAYEADEWNWVCSVYEERYQVKPHELTGAQLGEAADRLVAARNRAAKLILADAEKEFSETAQIGFGADGEGAAAADFEAVRGTFAGNKFVKEMQADLAALNERMAAFKAKAQTL